MKRSVAVMSPAQMRLDRTRLLIVNADGEHPVPMDDLAMLVVDHDAVQISGPLLGALGEAGVAAVFCGPKHLPSAVLLPFQGHSLMPQTLRKQFEAPKPIQKRIWQAIVREKLRSQARLLVHRTGNDLGLEAMAKAVFSGDKTNREALAAMLYFDALFGDGFARRRQGEQEESDLAHHRVANACLNYGYAVLRAAVARAVVLAGLHPSLGVHHRHRENACSLADDLMEPLRVLVDQETVCILEDEDPLPEDLTPPVKRRLLSILKAEVRWNDSLWPLDAALEAYAAGVRACLLKETTSLQVPEAF